MLHKQSQYIFERLRRKATFAYLLFGAMLAIITRSTIFVRQRSGEFYATVDLLAIVQIGLIGLICVLILVCPLKKYAFRLTRGTSARAFLWFCVFCVLSASWSPAPEYSLYRAIEFISQFFAVFIALLYFKEFSTAERMVLWVVMISILLMAGMHIRFYGLSLSPGHWHTNTFSTAAAMMLSYVVGENFSTARSKEKHLFYFGCFALFFLVIGTSGGSNVAAVCGVIVVGILCRNMMLFCFSTVFGLFAVFFVQWQDLVALLFPGKSLESIQAMTGRVGLWEMYADGFWAEPFLGFGFAITARIAQIYNTNMHNGFIGALFGTGFLGFAFFGVALLRILRESLNVQKYHKPGAVGCIAAIAAGLVNNMTISILGEQWALPTLAFVAFFALHTYVYKNVWEWDLTAKM